MKTSWIRLAEQLRKAGLCEDRLNERSVSRRYHQGYAVKREEIDSKMGNHTILAYGALWPAGESALEIGTIWVHPGERGKQLSMTIMSELLCLKKASGREIFLITDKWTIMSNADQLGFTPVVNLATVRAAALANRFTLGERLPSTITGNVLPGPQIRDRYLFYRPA